MGKVDKEITIGVAANLELEYASASAGDKVLFILYCNGAASLVKQSTLQGGSDDEIEIRESDKYVVKIPAADTEKLVGNEDNVTYKLFVWEPLFQMPYDPLFFWGDVQVNPRAGEDPQTDFVYPRQVYLAIGSLPDAANYKKGDLMTYQEESSVALYGHNGESWEVIYEFSGE